MHYILEEWEMKGEKGEGGKRTARNGTERHGTERNGTIQQKRNKNGTIYLKALFLERNGTISKKSERAQPYL